MHAANNMGEPSETIRYTIGIHLGNKIPFIEPYTQLLVHWNIHVETLQYYNMHADALLHIAGILCIVKTVCMDPCADLKEEGLYCRKSKIL